MIGDLDQRAAILLAELRRIDRAHRAGTRADIEAWSKQSREAIAAQLAAVATLTAHHVRARRRRRADRGNTDE